jgi:lipopolysaccharide transport system ATP-binding protein
MPVPIISVENLSKSYLVGHQTERGAPYQYTALRDIIGREIHNTARKVLDVVRGRRVVQGDAVEEFWALRDVNFEIHEGEVLGIIGRNGAGKSTLLKILSRITEPTAGRVTLRGRVASLLEVGTGFHPELTGRENIFLNGAILGMSRAEIRRKLDEIIAFAEIEKFLDTPVKRYSSGMYVRLAFAVAAHLEPEILIVDEVLAVGDAEFQAKCLGKMNDVSRHEGRTVLFVSHHMPAIENLCDRAIWLEAGQVTLQGSTSDVIAAYQRQSLAKIRSRHLQPERPAWAKPWVTEVRTLKEDGSECSGFALGEDIVVEVHFSGDGILRRPVLGVVVTHATRGEVGGVNTRMSAYNLPAADYSSGIYRCRLRRPPFLQGDYSVDVWLGDGLADVDTVPGAVNFTIQERDIYNSGVVPFKHLGVIFLDSTWSFENPASDPILKRDPGVEKPCSGAAAPIQDSTDDAPFFIVGASRSGTTLLRLILAGHSRIHIAPETWFIEDLIRELPLTGSLTPQQTHRAVEIMTQGYRWPDMGISAEDLARWAAALEAPKLVDVVNLVYRRQLETYGKQRLGDKTPRYINIVPQLRALYPSAKFVHLIRDGHDVAISFIDVGWAKYYDRTNFEWPHAIQRQREYLNAGYASKILDIRYESFVIDPETTVRRICEFLGEEFEPQMLDWQKLINLVPERERSVHPKLTQPLSKELVGAWQEKLSGWECFAIEACLHQDLRRLGYRLRFSSNAWRPLLTVVRWTLWLSAPVLKRGVPYLQRRGLLRRAIYI